jgi:hypothetical protein
LKFFGAKNYEDSSYEVRTKEEMEKVLELPQYHSPTEIQLLEVFMATMDIPWRLRNQISIVNGRGQVKKAAAKKVKTPISSCLNGANGHDLRPTVAIVGGTGYIGGLIVSRALEDAKAARIRSVRILSSRRSENIDVQEGCQWYTVDYDEVESIRKALEGAEILISAAGMQKSQVGDSKDKILVAAASAGIKIYVPSEFGTDYTQSRYLDNAMFEKKSAHTARAKELGLKTVSIFAGLTMERSFLRWVARDARTCVALRGPLLFLDVL